MSNASEPESSWPKGRHPPERLKALRTAARLMDDAVRIPVLGIRVGLDPLLGLLPGAGDLAAAGVSGWIVIEAARLGASPTVIARLLLNMALDILLGTVPVLGDIFDVTFRANRRNLRILERHLSDPAGTRRRSTAVLGGALLGVLGLLGGLGALLVWGVIGLWGALGG